MKKETLINHSTATDGKPLVVGSAYFVSVKGRGDIFVVAENIADACDKLDKITSENYIFIHSKSFECII